MDNKKTKVYPTNPLGIIALFVFLIEAISSVSLKILVDGCSEYVGTLVYFIISYPSAIAALFFGTLWFKREALFAPGDFKDENNFLKLMQNHLSPIYEKIEMERHSVLPNSGMAEELDKLELSLKVTEASTLIRGDYTENDLQSSIKKLEKLTLKFPSDSRLALTLAMLYKRVDNLDKAMNVISTMLDISLNNEDISRRDHAMALYNLACYKALKYVQTNDSNLKADAKLNLNEAIALDSKYFEFAKSDPDLSSINKDLK